MNGDNSRLRIKEQKKIRTKDRYERRRNQKMKGLDQSQNSICKNKISQSQDEGNNDDQQMDDENDDYQNDKQLSVDQQINKGNYSEKNKQDDLKNLEKDYSKYDNIKLDKIGKDFK
ncbi:UNKNOWN [Stylonychia lemnae]|uniref:Uncharacterized protein n=1 Tax=Stylonychia lemnae TaxID=5949 RepID=A0A078B1K5_STYLE|nr:UNKNOWN [Stylonychia lemnae]|eukprot:CDW87148.1 UNKNOWN [Stylonychia lemnae]